MLPRARTAAAGTLSADPVVPLVARRRIAGLPFGDTRSIRRGGATDTIGSRPYRPGDDPRSIDRHASARLTAMLDDDALIVREHHAEERLTVAVAVQETATMTLYPAPWLDKEAAAAAVERVLVASAQRSRSRLVHLDAFPDAGPRLRTGTLVFCISDYLDPPAAGAWEEASARGWDVIPIVIQDPLWEQSFPAAARVCLPLVDPGGRRRPVLLTRKEARERRAANETRLAGILAGLEDRGLEPVLIGSSDLDDVFDALLAWADARRRGLAWSG